MQPQYYIGLMSGTSMDGVDAVLVAMHGSRWHAAEAHAFLPYPDDLKQRLLALQPAGQNELHRSQMLAQELSCLYAEVVQKLLRETQMQPAHIRAVGCHGQTVRHAPEHGYSVQLANLPLLAEKTGIFTVGDFRSRDLAAGGQGAPLVPAFHQAVFAQPEKTVAVLNIGGIANISVLPPDRPPFGFDTGAGNMLMDAWTQHIWSQPYDKDGRLAAQGQVLPDLLAQWCRHPYFARPYPKSTGRELFSLNWLLAQLQGNESPHDVARTLVEFSSKTIADALMQAASDAETVYVCGGGIANISVLPPDRPPFGFDTGAGNMLMDAWTQHVWSQPYDKDGQLAAQGQVLPDLLAQWCRHPYFARPYPKSTGRELFSLDWLLAQLQGHESPHDVARTLVEFSSKTIADALVQAASDAETVYVCGGGIANPTLMGSLQQQLAPHGIEWRSTAELQLDPQWVEAAAFGWLAACWCLQMPGNPHHATGANRPLILGAGCFA